MHLPHRLAGIQQEGNACSPGHLAHPRRRLHQAAVGGHVGERDQLDPIVEQPLQGLQIHLSSLVAFHDADLGSGAPRDLQKSDVVAGVFIGRGHDAIAWGESQGVKSHLPGPGRVLLQRYFIRSAAQQPCHAVVQPSSSDATRSAAS